MALFTLLLLIQIRFQLWQICKSREMKNIYNILFSTFVILAILNHIGSLAYKLIVVLNGGGLGRSG